MFQQPEQGYPPTGLGTRGRGTRWAKGRRAPLLLLALPLVLTSCGGVQNTLNPHSHPAADIANLFWVMMGVSFGGLGLITILLVVAWVRRGKRAPGAHPGESTGAKVVIGMGIVFPVGIIAALFIISNVLIIRVTQAPAATSTAMTIQAIGHQWYWEFKYPGTRAVTADEMHIPVDTRINLVATTADVIHSFWVPTLNRKIDTIPGRKNRILIEANTTGVFRGQCAEYCGLQHAHMAMLVFVQTKPAFRAWLRNQAANARPPATPLQTRGQDVFLHGACSSCHTIRGTTAHGYLGPDLTHLATRTTLAGDTIPNRKGYLGGWIMDSQHIKPGNEMPDMNLTGPQLQAVLAYLEHLR